MSAKRIILLTSIILGIFITGCEHSTTASKEPESSDEVTKETETDEPTIFDQIIVGEPIDDINSLYNFTEFAQIQDYYIVGACAYGEKMVAVLYSNDNSAKAIVYDYSNGKKKYEIDIDEGLSVAPHMVAVSEEFSYVDDSEGRIIYLNWNNESYDVVQLPDVPESMLVQGEGEAIYYTVKDDLNIYKYIFGSDNCYSIYDGSDAVDRMELRYLISAGTSIVLYVEAEGYTGYAQLSLELQELSIFDGLEGELIYNDNEYIYTTPDKEGIILLYNPMTPRVIKEFRIENPNEINNLVFYREEALFLTNVVEDDETVIRFYDLEGGILKNQIIIPKEFEFITAEYFEKSQCILLACRNNMGEYKIVIWNTEVIEEILE